ncbi:hypothetical protein FKW77_007430 [Venturia effusa]|uniref:Uncharacterized protein n=1 Tax=Venturia effusa TaxID=50376 RepID=A0A517LLR2_9PEZI|nr:hypothetical protein FKW77_007430 [Venturia effusa]
MLENSKAPNLLIGAFMGLDTLLCVRSITSDIDNWIMSGKLSSLISFTRPLETREPVDRVYGVLGMTYGKFDITPDYSAEAREKYWELYLKVTTMEVESGRNNLHFLSFATIESKHPNLPSWVPNWDHFLCVHPFTLGFEYRAGLSPSDNREQPANNCLSGLRRLQVQAILIGAIAAVSPLHQFMHSEVIDAAYHAAETLKTVKDAIEIYNKYDPFSGGDGLSTSFARALIANRERDYLQGTGALIRHRHNALEDLKGWIEDLTARATGLHNPRLTFNFWLKHTRPYISTIKETWTADISMSQRMASLDSPLMHVNQETKSAFSSVLRLRSFLGLRRTKILSFLSAMHISKA